MTLMMAAAAVWGVLQLFAVSWPTRSVRLSTVLLALAVGVYGCGVATALVELAYTRFYADQSSQSLITVVNTTSYTVAPWVEELIEVSPLLLAGLSVKVRRQWGGLTDFVVLGAALGGGFGLLEAVLRYGLDANRAITPGWGLDHPGQLVPALCAGPGAGVDGLAPRTVQPTRPGRPAGRADLFASGVDGDGRLGGWAAVARAGMAAPALGAPDRGRRRTPHREQLRSAETREPGQALA
ncbi:hypothetical protein ABT274_36435 [Streptomyces sp. NPDC001127]|uniref:hypothetical protein n=1 Tax=Streptomyces sp. NPDC001127 TaxID=3154377 RepID=UPI00331EC08A